MITSVLAKNLKQMSFEHALYPKTIIIGPNGAGKSAIIQAIMLAIEGAVPGIAKKNESILDAVGCASGPLYVEATIEKSRIGRKYEQSENGVKQTMMVDRRKADAKAFGGALVTCKAPRIVAVDDFLSMSSKKMVAFLAGKVGGDELDIIATNIEKTKAELSHWQGKLKESEAYVSKLSGNIAQLDLPAGTIAEVRAELREKAKELTTANEQLSQLERDEAYAKAKEDQALKEQLAAEAKLAAHKELPPEKRGGPPSGPLEPFGPEQTPWQSLPPEGERVETFPSLSAPMKPPLLCAHAAVSIKLIIDQIRAVDCPTCKGGTALMVALRELKQWRDES